MFVHKTNFLMRALYPNFVWNKERKDKKIYLTFDDGPIPDVTETILDILQKYQAKATFFCIGNNIEKHPAIFSKLLQHEHTIGNHTYNHLNGWKTENELYWQDIDQCQNIIVSNSANPTRLFRPPYGKIKHTQAKKINSDYQVIMWDVLSGDFSLNLSKETILKKSLHYTKNGSIVLFHDSLKAKPNVLYTLPRFLEHFSTLGYTFEKL